MPSDTLRQRNGASAELVAATPSSSHGNGEMGSKGAPRVASDFWSIALLGLLYTLQGIPMGLCGSVPLLLAKRVGYKEQALFSFCSWPFSLKLLWAPLVDSLFWPRMGRRKSWLVPVQMVCGAMMLLGADYIDVWVGEVPDVKPDVKSLTAYFFVLYLLMATQDIAVDGWALTMLSRKNVSYASTCNSVGQTVGYFIAYVGFLVLNDPGTCNKYLRSVPDEDRGLVSLADFLRFFGVVFVLTTVYVWAFKPEVEPGPSEAEADTRGLLEGGAHAPESAEPEGVIDTYKMLWRVVRLPAVQQFVLVLFTCKVAFAVTDSATTLKIVEYGVPKEQMAAFAPVMVLLGIAIPLILGQATNGPRALTVFLVGHLLRMLSGVVYAGLLVVTRSIYSQPEPELPGWFYAFLLGAVALHEVAVNVMFVAQMSFFARVSDPSIGGTYMTLLNTIANLGSKWPISVSLGLLDDLTLRECRGAPDGPHAATVLAFPCTAVDSEESPCVANGGHCETLRDGYYVQFAVCTLLGVLWLLVFVPRVLKLQRLGEAAWHLKAST